MNTDSHPASVDVISGQVGPAMHQRGLSVSLPGLAEWPPRWPRRVRWWWQRGWTDLKVSSPSGAPELPASLPEGSGSPDCATLKTQKYKQKNNPWCVGYYSIQYSILYVCSLQSTVYRRKLAKNIRDLLKKSIDIRVVELKVAFIFTGVGFKKYDGLFQGHTDALPQILDFRFPQAHWP